MPLSQIDPQATYDANRPMLEIKGTTGGDRGPEIVAIHMAFKQGEGDSMTEAHGVVPDACLGKADWMVRFPGEYAAGPATVYAIAISYEPANGSLHTETWAQTVDIGPGDVYENEEWDPPVGAQTAAH